MKLNAEQLESMKDVLGGATDYQETYMELYDHVLTALEALPDDTPFAQAFYNIVEIELGGKRGIVKIEAVYKKTATREIFKRYLLYFTNYLLSPVLIISIVLTALLYEYMSKSNGWLKGWWLAQLCMVLNFIPLSVRKIVIFKARREGKYDKHSVINTVYGWFYIFPQMAFVALHIFPFLASLVIIQTFDSSMYTALGAFFFNIFNILAFSRLCIDEFKLRLTI